MSEKFDRIENGSSADSPVTRGSYFPPSQRKIHDSDVTFEEYHYYAQRTREEQKLLEAPQWQWKKVFSSKKKDAHAVDEKHETPSNTGAVITEEEWTNASRSFRTASWGAVFYLVSRCRDQYEFKANK